MERFITGVLILLAALYGLYDELMVIKGVLVLPFSRGMSGLEPCFREDHIAIGALTIVAIAGIVLIVLEMIKQLKLRKTKMNISL